MQVHDQQVEAIARLPLPGGEPVDGVPGDPILGGAGRPGQEKLQALPIRSGRPISVGRCRAVRPVEGSEHPADVLHEQVMDATGRGDAVGVRAVLAAPPDDGIQFGVRDAAGESFLPEVRRGQVRMVRVLRASWRSVIRYLARSLAARASLTRAGRSSSCSPSSPTIRALGMAPLPGTPWPFPGGVPVPGSTSWVGAEWGDGRSRSAGF